jgi:tetratricopeptide (TPR) repeat protein
MKYRRITISLLLNTLLLTISSAQQQQQTSDDPASLLVRASKALEKKDFEAAARDFERAAKMVPNNYIPVLGLSDVRFQQGRFFEALELARKAQSLAPDAPQPPVLMGRILVQMGAITQALQTYADLRQEHPQEAEAYLMPAFLLREVDRRDEAVQILEEGFRRGVDKPELAEELCFQLTTTGNRQRAQEVAEQALERYPNRGGLKLALGTALATEPGKQQEAMSLLTEALELGVPEPGRVHLELGQILLDLGQTEEAIDHLQEAVRLLPDLPAAHYRLGNALRISGDLEGAKKALQDFQSLQKSQDKEEWGLKDVDTDFNQAQELAFENRLHESLAVLNQVLEVHPGHSRAHALRAKVLSSMGRLDEALESATRARELASQMVENHYLEALLLVQTGHYASAKEVLPRILALDPNLAEAYELWGVIAANEDKNEEAVGHFEQALSLGADSAALHLNLAQALRKLGRNEESEEHMEAYRRLSKK